MTHLCGKLCLPRVIMPPASRVSGTWSRYKHYHHRVLGQMCGHAKSVVDDLRSHFSRNCLLFGVTVCKHSTQTPQTPQTPKWEKPQGYDSKIMIYHPLLKEKVPLILLQEKLAQWYACGPTVYDSSHIGHASSYVRLDIIRRILTTSFDIDTTFVMGVTDIDDKIIDKVKQTGQTWNELTKFYESEFFTSLAKFNVSPPSLIVRVTDHIPHIIDFIAGIESKGLAYRAADGSVYFEVDRYGQYGVFISRPDLGRVSEVDPHKKSPQDFALWKASKPGEPSWQSPWGSGRPGWHIECSAMASKIFGANFDIHTGGEDLAFPHHENELAQSCAYHGRSQWVNYWIHTGHLFLSGQNDKMSKSLKNVITVSEFLQEYTPNHFRMLCLLNHYRNRIEFSTERMEKSVSLMTTFNSIIHRCDAYIKGQGDCANIPEAELYDKLHSTRQEVRAAYADDLNTPKALASLMRLVKFTNQCLGDEADQDNVKSHVRSVVPVAAVGGFIEGTLKQLGLDVGGRKTETETHVQFDKAVETVVCSRTQIRQFARDKQFLVTTAGEAGIPKDQALKLMKKLYLPLWKISDKMREDILSSANVQINDDGATSTWSFVDSKKTSKSPDLEEKAKDNSLNIKNKGDPNKTIDQATLKSQSGDPSKTIDQATLKSQSGDPSKTIDQATLKSQSGDPSKTIDQATLKSQSGDPSKTIDQETLKSQT